MILTVTDVEYMGEYTLMCTFSYGVIKIVDLTPLLKYPKFEELTDKEQLSNLVCKEPYSGKMELIFLLSIYMSMVN